MQLPDFNYKNRAWDDWQEFHVPYRYAAMDKWQRSYETQFVHFETGELVYTGYGNHKYRGRFLLFNLEVIRPTVLDDIRDRNRRLTFTTPEGEHIPHAWFEPGQTLIIDHDIGRAYATGVWGTKPSAVPKRLRLRSRMYWPAPGEAPVTSGKVKLSRPRIKTPEDRALLVELRDACQLWRQTHLEANGVEKADHAGAALYYDGGRPVHPWSELSPLRMPWTSVVNKPFGELTTAERGWIAMKGFTSVRFREEHDYINVEVVTT